MTIIFLYKNILTDIAISSKIKYRIYPYKQIVIISHSFRKTIYCFLLNFFPKNSINNTIPIPTIKKIIAHKNWLSHWYWSGKIFFAVHKLASKVSFHGQILFKDHSINPVKEARVIIL